MANKNQQRGKQVKWKNDHAESRKPVLRNDKIETLSWRGKYGMTYQV
jgi:hypothetical protein